MRSSIPIVCLASILFAAACSPAPIRVRPVALGPARAASATNPPAATASATPRAARTPRPSPTGSAPATVSPLPSATPHIVVERGSLPPGFSLTVYATVPAPTSLAFGPDGRLYIASTNSVVYAVADRDGDRRAEDVQPFVTGLTVPLGLEWVGQELFVSYLGAVIAVS